MKRKLAKLFALYMCGAVTAEAFAGGGLIPPFFSLYDFGGFSGLLSALLLPFRMTGCG